VYINILVGKPALGRLKRRWKDNIELDLERKKDGRL
jgi:hypothetical protein